MPNMTLSLDEETHAMIRAHPGINWSHVAREAFRRKAREIHLWDTLLSDSDLTDADALRAGNETKEAILKRLGW